MFQIGQCLPADLVILLPCPLPSHCAVSFHYYFHRTIFILSANIHFAKCLKSNLIEIPFGDGVQGFWSNPFLKVFEAETLGLLLFPSSSSRGYRSEIHQNGKLSCHQEASKAHTHVYPSQKRHHRSRKSCERRRRLCLTVIQSVLLGLQPLLKNFLRDEGERRDCQASSMIFGVIDRYKMKIWSDLSTKWNFWITLVRQCTIRIHCPSFIRSSKNSLVP